MKNNKLQWLWIIIGIVLIIAVERGSAAPCNTSIDNLYFNTANTYNYLCGGTYYLNDSGSIGVIAANATNVTIDCNNSIIIGNGSGTGIIALAINATFKNCNLLNFANLFQSNSANTNITNSNISNGFAFFSSGITSFSFNNNYLNNATLAITSAKYQNALFYNNIINTTTGCGSTNVFASITTQPNHNNSFYNNTFYDTQCTDIFTFGTNNFNNSIYNNIVYGNNRTQKWFTRASSAAGNIVNIYNNTLYAHEFYRHSSGTINLLNVSNNILNNMNNSGYSFISFLTSVINENITLKNNSCYDGKCSIILLGTNNITIEGGTFNNIGANPAIQLSTGSINTTIKGVSINNTDMGIQTYNTSGNIIDNVNITYSANGGCDIGFCNDYDVSILIGHGTNNTRITNSNFNNYGTTGILIRTSNNILLENITCSPIPLTERNQYSGKDLYEPTACIGIVELFKTFIDSSNMFNESIGINITEITKTHSTNITINNLSYSGIQIILRNQGGINITHNLSNYWYRKFQYPTSLVDFDEFYIPNTQTQVYNYRNCLGVGQATMMAQDYGHGGCTISNYAYYYNISNTKLYFNNTNTTYQNQTVYLNISNGTTSVDDEQNATSLNYIAANIINQQITMSPNQQINVLDGSCDTIPVDGSTLSAVNISFCGGDYVINQGLKWSAQTNLTCVGTILRGNASQTIIQGSSSTTSPVRIINCSFANATRGIFSNGGDNNYFANNIFYNSSVGIRLANIAENNSFVNNFCYNMTSRCVDLSNTINTSIQNNFMYNSTSAIVTTANDHKFLIQNNYLLNNTGSGMNIVGGSNNTINNNSIIYKNSSATDYGIRILTTNAPNISITNNYVFGYKYGITLDSNQMNGYIANNIVSNCNLWCIDHSGNNSIIELNSVYNSSWNGIHFIGYNHTIRYNFVSNYVHEGIDAHNDLNSTNSGNSFISFNNITNAWDGGDNAISLEMSINNLINNNYIYDIISSTRIAHGIGVFSTNWSNNNTVRDNIISNVQGLCLYVSTNNSLFQNNTVSNCDGIKQYVPSGEGNIRNNNSYINNIGLTQYNFSNSKNMTMNIQYLGSYIVSSEENNFLNIYNQLSQYPYNDLYNVSTASVLLNNFDNASLTLSAGQSISVGDFNSSSCTYITPPSSTGTVTNGTITVNITIIDPDGTYINHTIRLYNDIGTLVAISNKASLDSQTQFTGLPIGNYYYNAIITFNHSYSTTCSNVNIRYTTTGVSVDTCNALSSSISSLSDTGTWLGILIAAIVGGIVIGLLVKKENPDYDTIPVFVLSIIMTALVISIGAIMLGGFC